MNREELGEVVVGKYDQNILLEKIQLKKLIKPTNKKNEKLQGYFPFQSLAKLPTALSI